MIKPVRNNILIQIHKAENSEGFEFVDDSEGNIEKATVLAIGPHVKDVKVKDVVYFKTYAVDTIEDGETKHHLITSEDVKAICATTTTKQSTNQKKQLSKSAKPAKKD